MTYFIKDGNKFLPANEKDLDIHYNLPVGNYIVKSKPMSESLYFEAVDAFKSPKKIYGIANKYADRIMNTFAEREVATGVLLTGEKGSGKSLLAKTLSVRAAALDIPTILINTAFQGDVFNQLIQGIKQPCVIIFDEFEKVYNQEEQESILTLLDGVFPSKKLFILTCNDEWRIDANMRNRPGRIFYMLHYSGLDADFITDYCNDNLKDCSHIDGVCKVASAFAEFNFDMLKALIEEMNRYNESPFDAIEMLNAKPSSQDGSVFSVTMQINGVELDEDSFGPTEHRGSPISENKLSFRFNPNFKTSSSNQPCASDSAIAEPTSYEDEDEDDGWARIEMNGQRDLKNIDPNSGTFTYASNGVVVKFSRVRSQHFRFSSI